ncbi:MAG: bifunctional hydroxymethylpyrimidine kinase/phosphomethylpyrimidine kinase [Gammaproteobacteria bacterium]|nr:bifunctional hydroxymethylpyrimidine kinase/phosphomethylpyrimidine kinase [Gammaproteobacteria bacterium]
MNSYLCVATIGGTDPTGGAGIQADIKTISATRCYAASIICALVSQNTQGVKSIFQLPPEIIKDQIECVFEDLNIQALKIGMLYNRQNISLVNDLIEYYKPKRIVIDPVMRAKDNSELSSIDVMNSLSNELFSKATLITPNAHEAEQLLNTKITTLTQQKAAAKILGDKFETNVLIKGGHIKGSQCIDVLYLCSEKSYYLYSAPRIMTRHTHGTGCCLAAAITCYLAKGYSVENAVGIAKKYVTEAIQSGSNKALGKGHGPVEHFYFMNDLATNE